MASCEACLLHACNRAGLRLGPDGKKCVDIDECAEGLAQCEQTCVNRDPRDSGLQFVCKCRAGFSIDIDNQNKCIPQVCKPIPTEASCPHVDRSDAAQIWGMCLLRVLTAVRAPAGPRSRVHVRRA